MTNSREKIQPPGVRGWLCIDFYVLRSPWGAGCMHFYVCRSVFGYSSRPLNLRICRKTRVPERFWLLLLQGCGRVRLIKCIEMDDPGILGILEYSERISQVARDRKGSRGFLGIVLGDPWIPHIPRDMEHQGTLRGGRFRFLLSEATTHAGRQIVAWAKADTSVGLGRGQGEMHYGTMC